MATKPQDSDFSAEKLNNISAINISLNTSTHFSALGFANGTITFVPFYKIVHSYWHDRTPSV